MAGCWVYVLKCADDAYYVGSSRYEEIEAREWEHQEGHYTTAWTRDRRPVKLIWAEHFDLITEAIAAERRIKGWRRDKKEALIRGDYDCHGSRKEAGLEPVAILRGSLREHLRTRVVTSAAQIISR